MESLVNKGPFVQSIKNKVRPAFFGNVTSGFTNEVAKEIIGIVPCESSIGGFGQYLVVTESDRRLLVTSDATGLKLGGLVIEELSKEKADLLKEYLE